MTGDESAGALERLSDGAEGSIADATIDPEDGTGPRPLTLDEVVRYLHHWGRRPKCAPTMSNGSSRSALREPMPDHPEGKIDPAYPCT